MLTFSFSRHNWEKRDRLQTRRISRRSGGGYGRRGTVTTSTRRGGGSSEPAERRSPREPWRKIGGRLGEEALGEMVEVNLGGPEDHEHVMINVPIHSRWSLSKPSS